MILNDLKDLNREIDSYKEEQDIKNDKAKREALEKDYAEQVRRLHLQMITIGRAHETMGFTIEPECAEEIDQEIKRLRSMTERPQLDSRALSTAKRKNTEIENKLKNGWDDFYSKEPTRKMDSLALTKGLSRNLEVDTIERKIRLGSDWNGLRVAKTKGQTNLDLLVEGLKDTDNVFSALAINGQVRQFLKKVNEGRASLLDLKPEILEWIKEHHLESRFGLGVRKDEG